jgi:hypothetical protein
MGVPLELPADLLPRALAELGATFSADPHRGQARLKPHQEALGVLLAASRASELASPAGVRLHELAGLEWLSFPR